MQNIQLTDNFYLNEFLKSRTATKLGGRILKAQNNPPEDVIDNIKFLASVNQQARSFLNASMMINSGYRCPELNKKVGGSSTSEHVEGKASDDEIAESFLTREECNSARADLDAIIHSITDKPVRDDVNANFYLFAFYAIFRHALKINQLIHEYGEDGAPNWIHKSADDSGENKAEILIKRSGEGYKRLNLRQALLLGC